MAKSGGRNGRPQGCSLRSHRLRRLKPLTPTLSPAIHSAMPSMLPCCTSDLKRRRKKPASVASLTRTLPREPLKPSTGAAVRDHRNAVRDASESLSAINRKPCPQSPESAPWPKNPPNLAYRNPLFTRVFHWPWWHGQKL